MFRPNLLAALLPVLLLPLPALARADNPKPLTEADLVKLIELQIDDKAVVERLEKGGVSFPVDTAAVERLKKAGASSVLLAAVQKLAEAKKAADTKANEEAVVPGSRRYVNVKVLEPKIKIAPLKEVAFVFAGSTQPVSASEVLASRDKYNQVVRLPADGHYDVYWVPQEGRALRMIGNLTLDQANSVEIRPEEHLGFVRVTGKDLPPGKEVIAVPAGTTQPILASEIVQHSPGYGENLLLPAGVYDLWLVPAAEGKMPERPEDRLKKAERLEEKLEVKPGKVKVIE
jgi:hypothetical protein